MNRKIKSVLLVVALAAQFLFAERVLLVVPARYDMVNLGFDLMEMLPGTIDLACYKGYASLSRLEFYDSAEGRWGTFAGEKLIAGAVPFNKARELVLVGESPLAVYFAREINWAQPKITPSGHYLHEVANAVHTLHPLTEKQWDKLAATYGFRLKKEPVQSWYEKVDELQKAKKAQEAETMAVEGDAVSVEVAPQPVEKTEGPVVEKHEKAKAAPSVEAAPVPLEDKTLHSPLAEEGDMVRFHIIENPLPEEAPAEAEVPAGESVAPAVAVPEVPAVPEASPKAATPPAVPAKDGTSVIVLEPIVNK